MAATLIVDDRPVAIEPLEGEPGALWLSLEALPSATGWELKPEGACKGEICVPIPPGREAEFVRPGAFNIAALARHLAQPLVADTEHRTWVIGEAAEERASALRSLQAPDFTLPDLDGKEHSLSDYRGRKIFLVSWASW